MFDIFQPFFKKKTATKATTFWYFIINDDSVSILTLFRTFKSKYSNGYVEIYFYFIFYCVVSCDEETQAIIIST